MQKATEVTRPDGSTFISLSEDVERLALVYRAADGYALRSVEGEITQYGFAVSGPMWRARTPIADAAREATASPYIGRRRKMSAREWCAELWMGCM